MPWNWKLPNWPKFTFDPKMLAGFEERFLVSSGEIRGAILHIAPNELASLRIELLSDEAMQTSAIEGEYLDRLSVQSSLRRQFGLDAEIRASMPREQGVTEMMVDVYTNFEEPLTEKVLCDWHRMLLAHDRKLETIGGYRTHTDAMQIVSGRVDRPTIHFEAPPSVQVAEEMSRFIEWFNKTAPQSEAPLPALTRAGLGHLYFESIHPFEDGNGRIGRALAEKSLSQNLGRSSLIALATTIEQQRKDYYDNLERHQQTLDVTPWLVWFCQTVLSAQKLTLERIAFTIEKSHFYARYRDHLNERQAKVISRMFREGPSGFKGGLSADKYLSITKTSRATATRDLQALVELGALLRAGERRYTRYTLNLIGEAHSKN